MSVSEDKIIKLYEMCPNTFKFGKSNIEFVIKDGWYDLMVKYGLETEKYITENLTPEQLESFTLVQVKQKFGRLVVYFNYPIPIVSEIDVVHEIWKRAESESKHIC